MDTPTISHPWYVIQRLYLGTLDQHMEYYVSAQDSMSNAMFTKDKNQAMIFNILQFAARTASAEKAEIRVLTSKEEAAEFGRQDEISQETNRS